MAIFTSATLDTITLIGLHDIPRACCIAIGSHITGFNMLRASFSDRTDPDLPTVQAISPPPGLDWLRLEDVDAETVNNLLDAWIPAPAPGHDRPLFPCLRFLCIGPTDENEVGALWELTQAGRTTIEHFFWEYFDGTRLADPPNSKPLNLSTLRNLYEISYEVTVYLSDEDEEDEPVSNPDYFDGLLSLLRTIERGNNIRELSIRVNFLTLSDVAKFLKQYNGWAASEEPFDEDEMDIDTDLQEKRTELEILIKERIPVLSRHIELDPNEAFKLMVAGDFVDCSKSHNRPLVI
ncbi:hypothetical protein C0995_010301 [Termitomyces sp. Mi166|nr:hypothetical protein C0995_010301 [Termitomyces sp. Mi166\